LLARAAKWNYKKEMPPVKSHLWSTTKSKLRLQEYWMNYTIVMIHDK
jgi:hypothetical protein